MRLPRQQRMAAVDHNSPATLHLPENGTVSIRMYRGLLGDSSLVRHAAGGRAFKMLIDCGVLQRIVRGGEAVHSLARRASSTTWRIS